MRFFAHRLIDTWRGIGKEKHLLKSFGMEPLKGRSVFSKHDCEMVVVHLLLVRRRVSIGIRLRDDTYVMMTHSTSISS